MKGASEYPKRRANEHEAYCVYDWNDAVAIHHLFVPTDLSGFSAYMSISPWAIRPRGRLHSLIELFTFSLL